MVVEDTYVEGYNQGFRDSATQMNEILKTLIQLDPELILNRLTGLALATDLALNGTSSNDAMDAYLLIKSFGPE